MAQYRGFTLNDLEMAAYDTGVEFKETGAGRGNVIVGRIFPRRDPLLRRDDGTYPFQRRSASMFNTERKVWAVCWHGHRDFLGRLFKRVPDGVVLTCAAAYRGIGGFFDNYLPTARRNIGSQVYPVVMAEACFCADHGDDCPPLWFRQLEETVNNGAYLVPEASNG